MAQFETVTISLTVHQTFITINPLIKRKRLIACYILTFLVQSVGTINIKVQTSVAILKSVTLSNLHNETNRFSKKLISA